MNDFSEISPSELENAIKLIGSDWMLITASNGERVNTMTASWGCLGVLWSKPICIVFVRPQRYTCELIDNAQKLSCSFFDENYRKALTFCGTHSGRDCDKFLETGLSYSFDGDVPIINESRIVLECKKLYVDSIDPNGFIFGELLENYKNGDYHKVYICEIEKTIIKKEIE